MDLDRGANDSLCPTVSSLEILVHQKLPLVHIFVAALFELPVLSVIMTRFDYQGEFAQGDREGRRAMDGAFIGID